MVKAKLLLEAVKLNPSALIDLFKLDLRPVGATPTADGQFNGCFYFHAGTDPWRSDVIFTDPETMGNHVYVQWPVEAKGLEWTTTSTQPRPTISFSNILGPFTQLNIGVQNNGVRYFGLANAKVTRIRTFGRFLYGMPEADPTCFFPPETWSINRKVQEDKEICVYELANPMDVQDLALPRRLVLADQCRWLYRGDGCGYTRLGLYDINDDILPGYPWNVRGDYVPGTTYYPRDAVVVPGALWYQGLQVPQWFVCTQTTNSAPPDTGDAPPFWRRDVCSLTVRGCGQRFGGREAYPAAIDLKANTQYGGQLPFGGFPGVQLQPLQTGVGQ